MSKNNERSELDYLFDKVKMSMLLSLLGDAADKRLRRFFNLLIDNECPFNTIQGDTGAACTRRREE